jgi:hypothetical protein
MAAATDVAALQRQNAALQMQNAALQMQVDELTRHFEKAMVGIVRIRGERDALRKRDAQRDPPSTAAVGVDSDVVAGALCEGWATSSGHWRKCGQTCAAGSRRCQWHEAQVVPEGARLGCPVARCGQPNRADGTGSCKTAVGEQGQMCPPCAKRAAAARALLSAACTRGRGRPGVAL